MPFLFENLEVYKKAIDIADELSTLSESFPKGNYYLSDQLNRAVLSIATNIAEGNGKYTKADRVNFFCIARGSAFVLKMA
ncbi:MAG: four helix bundle protein [Candidatus Omnitrophica bacterium]|nr:four helix bundle protein [Candidatus Omnitrophota bacterium]